MYRLIAYGFFFFLINQLSTIPSDTGLFSNYARSCSQIQFQVEFINYLLGCGRLGDIRKNRIATLSVTISYKRPQV